jgi:UDP-3-O-[3-hydroxymyristoyl] N-acetylglucosamine deacetylase/3-hydroxyacyl-[acyl-carrier-protein] dehydratase
MTGMPNPPAPRKQNTIARLARVDGIGFLTEVDVHLRFLPADPDSGITFRRVDLPGCPEVPARIEHVVPRQRRTSIQRGPAVIEMIEHVMAALAGLQVDNCTVELDAPETPGCDGSAAAFVEALQQAGLQAQPRPRKTLRIDRPLSVSEGRAVLAAYPDNSSRLVLSYQLDYQLPIGAQCQFFALEPHTFQSQIAPCRTFLLADEARAMQQAGLGKRLTESDLLIFGPDGPIRNILRFSDECVRHKILDMIGDLALAGADFTGHIVAHRSGHQLNATLVRSLLAELDTPKGSASSSPVLSINQIRDVLPHRYPFLLVDRVLALEPGRSVHAIKNVTVNEPFFQGHWPESPIMPGVLILEAIAQAAGILLVHSVDLTGCAVMIAAIDAVKLRRPVQPGDQLRIDVNARRIGSRVAEVEGTAYVDQHKAAEAHFRFVIVDRQKVA